MFHSDPTAALMKHGHGLEEIKRWRTEQDKAGKASGVDDFCRAHGICPQCHGAGENVSGVQWIDRDGVERSIKIVSNGIPETIGSLYERELNDARYCNYTSATCEVCGGTGKFSG